MKLKNNAFYGAYTMSLEIWTRHPLFEMEKGWTHSVRSRG